MDCDASCLTMDPASLLLHLIGFLVYGGVALCALGGLARTIAQRIRRAKPSL